MQDKTDDLISPPTRGQMIAAACKIDPKIAYQVKYSNDIALAAATPIYSEFIDKDGKTIPLKLSQEGRHGAGYIRVSTIRQKRDGWSIQDQATRIVDYFIELKLAFRIFSDSSLSGKLPMDSKPLISRMHKSNAERYERSYRAVFLTPPQRRDLGEARVAQMETWLSEQVATIEKGGKGEGLISDIEVDDEDASNDKELYRGRKRKNDAYRPGLSGLLRSVERDQISALAITDVSRLARSQSLQVIITDSLNDHKVNVVGLIETTDYINDRTNLPNVIVATVLSLIAEHKLREVSIGAFRGIAEMLREGKPHGSLPFWCHKDSNGDVQLVESLAQPIRDIIRLYLNDGGNHDSDYGFQKLANHLNENLDKYPPFPEKGKRKRLGYWSWTSLKSMLRSPSLCGEQHSFGQEWQVLPEIINKETWLRLQNRMQNRARRYAPVVSTDHLLAYMMRCQCGSTIVWNLHQNGSQYYTCDASRRSTVAKQRGHHIKMDAPAVEEFISRLAREHPNFLINNHHDLPERKLLINEIEKLYQQVVEIETRLPSLIEEARNRARADCAAMNRAPSISIIEVLASEDKQVADARRRLDEIKREIEQRKHLIESVMPSDRVEETAQRIQKWNSLSNGQKNEILRRLIYQIRGERTDSEMLLYIVMNNLQRSELPVIQMVMTPHGRGFTIKPPSVPEWLATW